MAPSGRTRAAAAVVALFAAVPASAQETVVTAGINARVATGTFGSAQSTTLIYAPATLQVAVSRLELSGYFPWVSITNGSVVPSQGGFVPMRGSMTDAPGAGISMRGPMGGMMGGTSGGTGMPGLSSFVPGLGTRQSGAGDIVFGAGYRVIDRPSQGLQVVASVRVKLPSASTDAGLGTGKRDVAAFGTLRKQTAAGWFYAEGGYVALGDPDGLDLRNAVMWAAGTGRRVRPKLYLLVSANGSSAIVPEFGASLEIGAGVGVPLRQGLNLTIVPSVGLTNASPRAALAVGLSTDLLRR